MQVLKAKGFTDADVAFGYLAGGLSQALRSQDIPDTSVASLEKFYPRLAQDLKLPMDHGGWALDGPSLEEFRQRYRQLYGVDIVGDKGFPLRIDVTLDTTRNGEQARFDMKTRDRHLLGLIEQQLTERHSVLVVFGAATGPRYPRRWRKGLESPKSDRFQVILNVTRYTGVDSHETLYGIWPIGCRVRPAVLESGHDHGNPAE